MLILLYRISLAWAEAEGLQPCTALSWHARKLKLLSVGLLSLSSEHDTRQ